jgi:hypothetical protein
MQRLRRAGSNVAGDPQAANEQFLAMQQQYQQQTQQVLTPQQWQSWSEMIGQQYDFPQTAFFPQDRDRDDIAQRPDPPQGTWVPYGRTNGRTNTPQQQAAPADRPQNNTVR